MSPTPSNQLRFINSPQVLPVSPSRLHPRIALTRPGDARVKAGGSVPLVDPELSLLCLETMGKKRLCQSNISICKCPNSIRRATSAILDVRLPAGNSDRFDPDSLDSGCVILRVLKTDVKQTFQKIPGKPRVRATGRNRPVAKWLRWLCNNGSVVGRC